MRGPCFARPRRTTDARGVLDLDDRIVIIEMSI